MKAKLACAGVSVLVSLTGCGAEALRPSQTLATSELAAAESTTGDATTDASAISLADTSNEETAVETAAIDLSLLPAAPWSMPPMSPSDAPRQLLSAWQRAENRDSCAPLSTLSLGAASGARARTSTLSGGWLVEFDRPGLPGVDRDGNECDTCGRSVVGIAGTSMQPDALFDTASQAPTYSDGSHAQIEVTDVDGESVASVTFTVAGQDCVYEVWSLLGPDHLAEVVDGLRLVAQPGRGSIASR